MFPQGSDLIRKFNVVFDNDIRIEIPTAAKVTNNGKIFKTSDEKHRRIESKHFFFFWWQEDFLWDQPL